MGMNRLASLLILGLFLFDVGKIWAQPDYKKNTPIARINKYVVTVQEFHQLIKQFAPFLRVTLSTEGGIRKAVVWIIDWKLMLEDAVRMGVDREPDVKAKIAAAREKVIVGEYLRHQAKRRVLVSESELKDFYIGHREKFKISEAIKVDQILVRTESEAREVLEDLKKGADFSTLAKERSLDPSRRNGGQMGWLERRVMDPDFANAAFTLTEFEISGVVHTKFGYHIIRVDDIRPAEYAEYETVKERIKNEIERKQKRELIIQIKKDLRKNSMIGINEENLKLIRTDVSK
jgi:peptidyl-prolyl cis-trans isomerase C